MTINILNNILYDKLSWLKIQKKKKSIYDIQRNITISNRNFYKKLQSEQSIFILEIKKSSPSKGIINNKFNINNIIKYYKRHASAISILTDEKYFQGKFEFLSQVSTLVKQPILCKDFFIDPYQIYLARYHHADAILLMLSVLNDQQYKSLEYIAHQLNMGILTEINNISELNRAIQLNVKIIGINNRNLKNLNIDINRTYKLAPLIPKNKIIISESGIKNNQQVKKLKNIVNGFLIGSSIMKSKNIGLKINSILFGNNKICGLTRPKDAKISKKLGAVYGGLIFIPNSLRYIKYNIAKNIINSTKLKYVGVFQNENIDKINFLFKKLNLYAIQLHGNENQKYIINLKKKIYKNIKIWKAIYIEKNQKKLNFKYIDYYLFDNFKGGSGISFDWKKIKNYNLKKVFLSGGLSLENCDAASKLNCFGLDFNSKLEKFPGIKDHTKLKKLFKKLKSL
ncbi:bifunctional indole-3-glycerol-phosphate synthase TrpC/phosphoribosylanthranilate isomerase TrpF [Buchnera aphidicola]|uniref:Multifunctional fusion protein n=1 Tax=Buchnera aphidicola (Therioaphis trifolii) TaxID=1241884 RepID=A0A4D6YD73_9GAMM|nr:bifunctional indole-3-glycerol-phosphate synthase TrpC/phosphoribosylanthranilate isomerase TrpF [Buchnera aphidicola]QCI27189.1 bifunctional indole-3-glycerol-phosphate synthase TrpC/phosphoribosylanthranilate isomerase TrpF [Buchnera aphidicola (Therioaphis trifolii)]